jgi:predicted ATPase
MYIWGEVGTGKSMVMDCFFDQVKVSQKRRVHFHQFMLEVHRRMHKCKQRQLEDFGRNQNIDLNPEHDAIYIVACEIAQEASLLCFDEFQVTDVADAMIMRKLFGTMFDQGTVVVTTSNRPPGNLYEDGINFSYFEPFIGKLQAHCATLAIKSETDHRLLTTTVANHYISPLSRANEMLVDQIFNELAANAVSVVGGAERGSCAQLSPDVVDGAHALDHSTLLRVSAGRTIKVPRSAPGVCYFDFGSLCRTDTGAADFKAICMNYHTVILAGVPKLTTAHHNEARRLITLIDELYEHQTRLICTADANAEALFSELQGGFGLGMGTDRPGGPAAKAVVNPARGDEEKYGGVQETAPKVAAVEARAVPHYSHLEAGMSAFDGPETSGGAAGVSGGSDLSVREALAAAAAVADAAAAGHEAAAGQLPIRPEPMRARTPQLSYDVEEVAATRQNQVQNQVLFSALTIPFYSMHYYHTALTIPFYSMHYYHTALTIPFAWSYNILLAASLSFWSCVFVQPFEQTVNGDGIPAAPAGVPNTGDFDMLSFKKVTETEDEQTVAAGELASVLELGFAFRRASSRLVEMRSEEYLEVWGRRWRLGARGE